MSHATPIVRGFERHDPCADSSHRAIVTQLIDTIGGNASAWALTQNTVLTAIGDIIIKACKGEDLKQAWPQPRDVATHHESVKTTAQHIRTQAIIKALAWPCGMSDDNGALAIGNGSWVGF